MKKITLETFLEFNYLGSLNVSPDETRFAFVSAQANNEKNQYDHTLYLGEKNQITKLIKTRKNSTFAFLNNEKLLIDLQKNKPEETKLKEQSMQSYYTYNLTEKTLKKAFELPFKAKLEKVLNKNTVLFSASLTEADHILYEGSKQQRKDYLKAKERDSAYEDIDQIPYYYNGQGFKTNQAKQLLLYDIQTNTITRIFDKQFSFETFTLSEDKKTIYYTGKMAEKIVTFTSNIFAYDIESASHQVIYNKLDYNMTTLVEVNRTLVVAAKTMKAYGLNENADFYTLKNQTLTPLAQFGEAIGNTVGTDCRLMGSDMTFVKDNTLFFVSTIDDHCEIKSLSLDGTIETVYQMEGAIDGFVKMNDKAIIIGMENQELQEVYQYDFTGQHIEKISHINTDCLDKRYVSKPQTVVVKKANHEVKGFVLLPENYNPNQSYKAILNIHGGPKTVYGQIYYHEMQYWVNEGYVVFFANPRGSDGKGNAFADIRGQYGTIDYDDLMAFTDEVLSIYKAINKKELYVTGGSYGGFMTNWIVSQTDRFKAAVTQRSISNWVSFYGTSDIGYYFARDQTAGHPILDKEKLYDQSPLKYVMNVKTPLLFIHSDQDLRCPMEQAQQFYTVLKTQGVDTKLIWFKDETHELSRSGKPQARIKRLSEITNWFKKYT